MLQPEQDLEPLLLLFLGELRKGTNFELVQAQLGLVLRVHGLEIAARQELKDLAEQLLDCHNTQWERIEDLMQYNLCLLGHLTRMQ